MSKEIEIGCEVMYSRTWLRDTGQFTGDVCFMRGRVLDLKPLSPHSNTILAKVEWDDPEWPEYVNVRNLVRVDCLHLEPR